ncbi:uncharacterized protein CIMG_06687 [Coccidioides immitis RS]|uniref:Uncharacterized protein n=3 Tax=Coccidioides immitis TaxID=5501 RepID=J3K8P5_COCIM|nr:uncharacterized protein CIMG_06687 [Coccidioides immitis RS]EAS31208.3 hypothetical protein CIMG_06687 [Coccidioides immitis RS]KMP03825.1 hypothetical protein CIRG_03517 [Coccidioides immitis RMSCC 2394]KMU74803.1 hypothetical protein CISG_00733 [Coccidioides immitis RMSCC 3703]
MADRYIPPALRKRTLGDQEPGNNTVTYHVSDIEAHFGYHREDDRGTNLLRKSGALNAAKDDQDALAYIMVYKDAHPFWATKNEVLCKANLDLLPGATTLAGNGDAENVTYTASFPVFVQDDVPGNPRANIRFCDYYGIVSIRYLEPHSDKLVNYMKAKFAKREPKPQGWNASLRAKWGVITMGRDASGDDHPQIKPVQRSVNEILFELRSLCKKDEEEEESAVVD